MLTAKNAADASPIHVALEAASAIGASFSLATTPLSNRRVGNGVCAASEVAKACGNDASFPGTPQARRPQAVGPPCGAMGRKPWRRKGRRYRCNARQQDA